MRTFSLVLLGLAVGAALLSRSPSRPPPTPRPNTPGACGFRPGAGRP